MCKPARPTRNHLFDSINIFILPKIRVLFYQIYCIFIKNVIEYQKRKGGKLSMKHQEDWLKTEQMRQETRAEHGESESEFFTTNWFSKAK